MKKIISFVMALFLLFSVTPAVNVEAKVTNEKKTVYVGAQLSLILIGYGNPKVVSKNPKVVSVKQNKNKTWIATAKKPGKAKVVVTGKGNTANFHFTVNPLPTEKKFEIKKIKYPGKFLLQIKNKNKESVSYGLVLNFVDKDGNVVQENTALMSSLGVKETTIHDFYISKEYEDVKLKFEVRPSSYRGGHKYLKITDETINESGLKFTVTNKLKVDLSSAKVGVLFYNEEGEVVGYNYKYALEGRKAGASEEIVIDLPYDKDYKKFVPASYKLLVIDGYDTKYK